MYKIIKDNSLIMNLFLSLVTLFLFFLIWLKWLDFFTNHNHFIEVPDFTNIHINDLDNFVSLHNLKYEIIDSVSYKYSEKGVVISQDPLPSSNVKRHRKIYLTINSLKTSKVYLPDIFDLTLREAVNKLQKNLA